jgi:hypothetical protein
MIPLRWLVIPSSAAAAFSLLVFPVLFFLEQARWIDAALSVALWCAIASVLLLIAGLFMHRLRGLWLVIPMLIAWAGPIHMIASAWAREG